MYKDAVGGGSKFGKAFLDIFRYTVYGVKLNDRGHQEVLNQLMLSLDLDLWTQGTPNTRDALAMVSPKNRELFLNELDVNGMEHYLHIEDVSKYALFA